jgi:choline-phosphate cytidylyltransferase
MPPKRKRANTSTKNSVTAVDVPQPSSRDASDEDATDPVLQEVKQKQQEQEGMHPPAKRTRSTKVEAAVKNGTETTDAEADDDGHVRAARKSSRASRDQESDEDAGIAALEAAAKESMRMDDVPQAGLVEPRGYHMNPPPTGRPVRVYADGVFDLFHLGHMRALQQAKQAFPNVHLIVGVTGDKETHRRKGLTVLSGKERADSVRHCRWVDEVVEDCPWIVTDAPGFLEKYKIDYVAHDDLPYGADEGDDIYSSIKAQGKFLVTQRTEGLSTTGIITKIVRDYEKYISRQLKRGTPRQELNVSWLKKNELDVKRAMADLRSNIKSNWTTTGQELGKELRQFWQSSRPASPSRMSLDRPEGSNSDPHASMPVSPSTGTHLKVPRPGTHSGSSDFAAGYSLGLIGGVRSWMARSRRNLNESQPDSTDSDDSAEDRRSEKPERGRAPKSEQEQIEMQLEL